MTTDIKRSTTELQHPRVPAGLEPATSLATGDNRCSPARDHAMQLGAKADVDDDRMTYQLWSIGQGPHDRPESNQ